MVDTKLSGIYILVRLNREQLQKFQQLSALEIKPTSWPLSHCPETSQLGAIECAILALQVEEVIKQ